MMNLLNNVSIKLKLFFGYGLMIVAMVLVGGLSYVHFVTVAHEVEEMELAAEELALAANIEVKWS